MLRVLAEYLSPALPGNTGDGLRLAESAGAALAKDLPDAAALPGSAWLPQAHGDQLVGGDIKWCYAKAKQRALFWAPLLPAQSWAIYRDRRPGPTGCTSASLAVVRSFALTAPAMKYLFPPVSSGASGNQAGLGVIQMTGYPLLQ